MSDLYVRDEAHPVNLGLQINMPLFVKIPFRSKGKQWDREANYPWLEMDIDLQSVIKLYAQGFIYHNRFLEVEAKVGDRLGEMNTHHLKSLTQLLNHELKVNAPTEVEFKKRRCRVSKIPDKQRALIRRFLSREAWLSDYFIENRDRLLGD